MIKPLTEVEQDYGFSQGMVEGWLENDPKTPPQIMEHLRTVTSAISAYREKYISIQEDYDKLQTEYNRLMAANAQHLAFMSQQKEQLDEALIREQRAYQKDGTDNFITT